MGGQTGKRAGSDTEEAGKMFPTTINPKGYQAVVLCPHVDQGCPTVAVLPNGDVVLGSTLHGDTIVLTRDEFATLLADGATALEQANELAGLPVVAGASVPIAA